MLKTNALGKIIYETIKIDLQMQHCSLQGPISLSFPTFFKLVISHILNENLYQYIDSQLSLADKEASLPWEALTWVSQCTKINKTTDQRNQP